MARPRTAHVELVKQKLIARLRDGLHRAGDRFFSTRAIASHYEISYQTADRLLRELVAEGHLERRHGSGTYLCGGGRALDSVQLVFNRRARRAGSFGARLMSTIEERLNRSAIRYTRHYVEPGEAVRLAASAYPILWESPDTAASLAAQRRSGLLLNDRPAAGLGALLIDSVSVDDALGGACAAELIGQRLTKRSRVAVLAGPWDDARSAMRVSGFTSRVTPASVIHTTSWFREDAIGPAQAVLATRPDGVFACNDRLAQALLEAASESRLRVPVVFGFDDAPVAEALHLSTIAIPWQELANTVAATAVRRIGGDTSPAFHLLLSPRPIVRLT
ncbi:MAG TPA: substrate-binding domain-containing protein [Tepidisphaeraceae bacterium]|jgi:hypothetical protein|nr:substrate-binding domain-containing protein [Tepidisphaeraceae bacterium]